MNLSMRDKKILLMFLGVLLFALSFLFVYKPQMEEAAQISANNDSLQERLSQLLDLAQNREQYVNDTETMQAEIDEYCKQFPYTVRSEDGIVLAMNMENSLDMSISNVGLGERTFVYSIDGGAASDGIEAPEETMMEQGNQQTQDQINEIEGTDGETDIGAAGTIDSSNSVQASIESDGSGSPALYRTQDTMQFTCTYSSLKDAVKYLDSQSGRMTLDNINASFDSATGNLTGTMTVNLFSMTGGNTSYSEPDAGSVAYGTDNIFGTIEKKKKKSKKNKQKAAESSAESTENTDTAADSSQSAESETQQ